MKKILIILTFIAVSIILAGCSSDTQTSTTTTPTNNLAAESTNSDVNDYIAIPISDITTTVKKYTHTSNGVDITYFTVLGSDGKVRTAFDACDVCGGYKGYTQQGTDVRCVNCGRVFQIDDLGSKNVGGGCWPSKLSYKIEGDNVLISKTELDKGRSKFA